MDFAERRSWVPYPIDFLDRGLDLSMRPPPYLPRIPARLQSLHRRRAEHPGDVVRVEPDLPEFVGSEVQLCPISIPPMLARIRFLEAASDSGTDSARADYEQEPTHVMHKSPVSENPAFPSDLNADAGRRNSGRNGGASDTQAGHVASLDLGSTFSIPG